LAWLPPGALVLEPSAGTGALVSAALRTNPTIAVTAVEPNAHRAATITDGQCAVTVHTDTFEAFTQRATAAGDRFAAVVMNPPDQAIRTCGSTISGWRGISCAPVPGWSRSYQTH
jgi:predicted RNA methylase